MEMLVLVCESVKVICVAPFTDTKSQSPLHYSGFTLA